MYKPDLALNNQRLICHKTKLNQNYFIVDFSCLIELLVNLELFTFVD